MADFTISAGSFPASATVKAYLASLFVGGTPTGAPEGSETASATAAADGSVAFAGLANSTSYYAYSLVGSEHRYIRFTTPAAATGGSAFNHLTEDPDLDLLWIDTTGNEITGLFVSADNDYSTPYTQVDAGGITVGAFDVDTYAFVAKVAGSAWANFVVHADGSLYWSDGTGLGDTALERVDVGVLGFEDVLEGPEIADPAAPAANKGRLYFKDVGGKTALVARFPTGAVQQVAIEP